MPITLIGVTLLVFCLSRMVPGGPVDRMLQEQTMGALIGDKVGHGANTVGEDDLERLEEMFNLHEPMCKAYLQWLGLWPQNVSIEKAETDAQGQASLTLTSVNGSSAVLDVTVKAGIPSYQLTPWMENEGWEVRYESSMTRAQRWANRHGVTGQEEIQHYAESGACPPRVVASRSAFQGVLQGNLGLSYKYHEPVAKMIWERLPVSLYFGILGAMITYMVSIPLGVYKALRHRSLFDSLSSVFIFAGYAVPGFALGGVLLVYLGARLEWFPLYGLTSAGFETMSWWDKVKDLTMHTVLPLLCYVISSFAMTTMMMKHSLMENLTTDYVRTAVAKGVSFRGAVVRHAFRNSIIPIVSTLGGVICAVVSGSVLIERVFDIQGFGLLSYQALIDKDYSLVMGTLLLTSVLIILGNLLSDMLVAIIDPRIRFGHA